MIKKILMMCMLVVSMMASSAWAMSLQDAKAQGLVGEQPNGYLGIIKSSAEVKALVTKINAMRNTYYKGIVGRQGSRLSEVEAMGGKKAMTKTPAGQYIQTPSGVWKKK